MRLNPDMPIVGDFPALVGGDFSSTLPPVSTLQRAWADGTASYLTSPEQMGQALAENGVRAFRFVAARSGVEIGVPSDVIGDFTTAISLAGSDQAIAGWIEFVGTVADAIIDIALEGMGAVPIVGWLAKAVKAVLELIGNRLAKGRPKPAMLLYDKADDEFQATGVLKQLRSLDWTFGFMPQFAPTGWSDWKITKQDTGWLMQPKDSVRLDGMLGAVPGGAMGSKGVQSRNCWSGPTLRPASASGFMDPKQSNLQLLRRAYGAQRKAVIECLVDIYETTPSVSRVMLASWQQMTAGKTATLFQVDTRGIVDAWDAYVETAVEASRIHTSSPVTELGGQQWTAWRNLEEAMYARGWNFGDGRPARAGQTLADVAARYTNDLRGRQRSAMDTLLVAYAQEGQACFADPAMRELLIRRRAQLLTDDDRWSVRPEDVLDLDYRNALLEATKPGDRPLSMAGASRRPGTVPRALPLPSPDGSSGGGAGGGGTAIAVVAGLLGLGLVGRRLIRGR